MARKLLVSCSLLALFASLPAFAAPVIVKGVPRMGWAAGKECQHIAALWAALQAMGCPAGYEDLLVASGYAFNTAWWPGWYSYGTIAFAPEHPLQLVTYGAEAVGAIAERRPCASDDDAWKDVCASLDQGRPVITWKAIGAQVICGYDPGGRQVHVQGYHNTTDAYQVVPFEIQDPIWPLTGPKEIVLLEYDRTAKPPDLDWPTILERAVRFADWPPAKKAIGDFVFGLAAYDAWAATLRKGPDKNGVQTDVELIDDVSRFLSNARTAASVVLQEHAALHEGLGQAATHYMAEAELIKGLPTVLCGGEKQDARADRMAAMKAGLQDPQVREQTAQAVLDAKAEEVAAVEGLRRALKDLGPQPKEPAPPKPAVVGLPVAPPEAPQPPVAEPPKPQANPTAEEHCQKGLELKRAGQASQAADELRAAIAADPKHVKAHYTLGWVLLDLKDKPGAAAEFRKVIELAPDSDEAKEAKKALERIGQ